MYVYLYMICTLEEKRKIISVVTVGTYDFL